MIVERMEVSGGWRVSDLIDGYYVTRRYFGYTKREAMQLFRQDTGTARKSKSRKIPGNNLRGKK